MATANANARASSRSTPTSSLLCSPPRRGTGCGRSPPTTPRPARPAGTAPIPSRSWGPGGRAAEAQVQVVRAGLAPTVSLSAGGSLGNSTGSPTTSGQVSAGVTYLIYDGGLREAQIRQAEAQAESARQALAAVITHVALQTVQAYMGVIVADQVILLREQAVTLARTQLAAAEANFRAGRVARADVIRAGSVLAAADYDLVNARGQAETSRTTLRTAMGLEGGGPLTVTAPAEPPPQEIPQADALQRALQRP